MLNQTLTATGRRLQGAPSAGAAVRNTRVLNTQVRGRLRRTAPAPRWGYFETSVSVIFEV